VNRKHRVLIVDDSRIGLTHLEKILEHEYTLYTASSGVEAIQIAKSNKPDIILLDVVMPHMDGYETLTILRSIMETKDIPVIFITSLGNDSDEEKGLNLGAVDYITKPYNPVVVKLRVSIILKMEDQMKTIENLSLTDSLTKLPNRKYFNLRLREEWARAKKESREIGAIFLNIDNFRDYNVKNGYDHGDALLIGLSEIVALHGKVAPGDVVARWADDTFAVLLQNSNAGECSTVAENIRIAAQELKIEKDDGTFSNITISAGVSAALPADSVLKDFISDTDAALFLAKELGKNQVVVH